ncbi:hypothetical protein LKO27_11205 [Tessaracoccus sp. OS52]|uniref:monovalent cation/H+ antiporter complex subunit F n=1 Tax=Tessaracoccus sp. OS52 TaxID=2886691 RepID=UPI001D117E88|nr:monovalent cation/H+ antiporter complex subunit F [Tessaracoccus sp. OS52]MCC2593973.1 hypothetical protein [Tessaracoccus sp. OS52]
MISIITDLVLSLAAIIIGAAGLIGVGRIVAGPSSIDRIIASDLMVAIVIGGVALWIVHTGQDNLLVVLLVLSMLGFTGATALARLLGDRAALARRHKDKDKEARP